MSMTRNDFELLARTLRSTRPGDDSPDARWQWDDDVKAIADMCKNLNARFDRAKFIAACEE